MLNSKNCAVLKDLKMHTGTRVDSSHINKRAFFLKTCFFMYTFVGSILSTRKLGILYVVPLHSPPNPRLLPGHAGDWLSRETTRVRMGWSPNAGPKPIRGTCFLTQGCSERLQGKPFFFFFFKEMHVFYYENCCYITASIRNSIFFNKHLSWL